MEGESGGAVERVDRFLWAAVVAQELAPGAAGEGRFPPAPACFQELDAASERLIRRLDIALEREGLRRQTASVRVRNVAVLRLSWG